MYLFFENFFVSSVASVISKTSSAPIELWRIQRQNPFIPHSTLKDVIKKEGLRYLWKGNAINLLKETDSAGQVFIAPARVDALYKLDKKLKEDIFDIRKDTKLDSVAKREKIRERLDQYEEEVRKLAGNNNLFDENSR